MLPSLEEIPRLRRALGLTQARLAALGGVSQSTVTKIERGQLNPSYAVVKHLIESLEAERQRRERTATVADVRTHRVVSVVPTLALEAAVAEMRHHKISQLPVVEGTSSVGSLSERTVTGLMLSGTQLRELARLRVRDVMEPPFPTLDERAPVSLAAGLLQHYSAVLTTGRGQLNGIVTRSDLLKLV
ncbi:MAG TPA: CBS domain-containing protein [Thermoplasmata archaeon]|nr:CBS domain-containing protein [Thermoplasmata archaeon]